MSSFSVYPTVSSNSFIGAFTNGNNYAPGWPIRYGEFYHRLRLRALKHLGDNTSRAWRIKRGLELTKADKAQRAKYEAAMAERRRR